jgi:hypothetical protein
MSTVGLGDGAFNEPAKEARIPVHIVWYVSAPGGKVETVCCCCEACEDAVKNSMLTWWLR